MRTVTVEMNDELAAALEAEAAARGGGMTPAKLLIEFAAESIAPPDVPEPPAEVMAEVRRRQETPLSECPTVDEAMNALLAKLREDDRLEREGSE